MRPAISFPTPVIGEDAKRLAATCPMSVFDIEDLNGVETLHVANDLNCTYDIDLE